MPKFIYASAIFFVITSGFISSCVLKAQNHHANQVILNNSKIRWAFDKNNG